MAYICTKNIPCEKCGHYRRDPDNNNEKVCFAMQDEARAGQEARHED